MSRTICISGFSELTRGWANEQPDGVELWVMNEAHTYLKREAQYWFQLHPRYWNREAARKAKIPEDGYGRHPIHLETLKTLSMPIWMQEVDERIPASAKYPYEEIVERYGRPWVGGGKRPYLTSTAAYMVALAVKEHDDGKTVGELRMAGIELAIGTEYFHQRACLEYWLGIAYGKGINIELAPSGTSILTGPIYTRDHLSPLYPEALEQMQIDEEKGLDMPYVAVMEDEDGNPVGLPEEEAVV